MSDPQPSGRPWALLVLLVLGAIFVILLLMLKRPASHTFSTVQELQSLGTVPAFRLTDASGATVTLDSLKGKIWVADFIFTKCEGTCPMMTSALYQLNKELDQSEHIQFVSISVDPANDSPEVMKQYAESNGLPREHWYFLTGDRGQIFSLAKSGFHLPVSDSDGSVKLITHSSRLALVDRIGNIRGYYDGTDSSAVPDLKRDIAIISEKK